ncbi:hypothetical protein GOBAR_AA21412 [Gossypium barbadense]|uniref:Tyrosine-protein kinase catalytic domain-containing protein n=1 Tax=Gossypium barbadense TaxID=3634 RepID=A0A2P5X7F4_GOSBA|nr:hypothetical protein GOBAR_AA21412 [Gossypium barbadense]
MGFGGMFKKLTVFAVMVTIMATSVAIFILSQIDHKNIVKLLGYCLETEVPLLVYEFIPNGTLSLLIHNQNEKYPRSWDTIKHCCGSYIKSSNILIDEKFRAEVSNFGTSRSIGIDKTHLMAISTFGCQEKRGLVSYFMSSMEENQLLDNADVEIGNDGQKDEVVTVAQLAKSCLNLDERYRPTMKEVVIELERLRTRQGDCIHYDKLEQAEVVVRKSTDITSTSE